MYGDIVEEIEGLEKDRAMITKCPYCGWNNLFRNPKTKEIKCFICHEIYIEPDIEHIEKVMPRS